MVNRLAISCLTALVLQGCATPAHPPRQADDLIREGLAGTDAERLPDKTAVELDAKVLPAPTTTLAAAPRQQILQGDRQFVANVSKRSRSHSAAQEGQISFNFVNQPIAAVINTVLGDVLQADYSIGQGVTGEVSFSTAKPVDKGQALSILQTLLAWTDNALVLQVGRYWVVPASQAVAGQMTPQLRVPAPGSGLSARLFVLDYISAVEMRKLLKPFARENAFLLVDASRNVLVLSGTPDELANYQDTIDTFDLNWLKGMSIGVFGLQRANVAELMPELNQLFGPRSASPLAGMVRFLPIERTNAIVAISSQPEYLSEVGRWIDTIDQGGGYEPQMYVYDVRNMKANDLARYLRQIYVNEVQSSGGQGQVAPGLRTLTLSAGRGMGSISGGMPMSSAQDVMAKPRQAEQDEEEQAGDDESGQMSASGVGANGQVDNLVRITAQRGSNQLLVRCRPTQWQEIQAAIRRLDNPPLQVQIETRILEVSLDDGLDLGVQWYLGRLAGNSGTKGIENASGSQGALGGGGVGLKATDSLFYSFVSSNLQVALHALESSGNTRVLSAPSLVVMNNQNAQIQVGDNIPINQTSINLDNTSVTTSSVQYVQTGVILDVVPRINPGGLVYMDIQQQVSDASKLLDSNGNPNISTRAVSTQVAVQSGHTVLLGGLIKQNEADSQSRVPWLGRVPGLGWLFSNTQRSHGRTELIVLITPKVVSDVSTAREVTDEYKQQLQLIRPKETPTESLSNRS
ncbi:type II secretion system secretin GspD [Pseudomonas qingdaonensis]|uniref:Type II secretion system secretin GspD n=1 Tax=Pseudomonas qingdaonensis TaxID=2056231 RepID=A0ABX8DRN0_9PSED|nr:type II secretion system secretin GspD [Pseudomonas qingdaonensis]QVL18967.1 type II secretion system secretin GspD [Pseudomonas qingdaonensis]